MHSLSLKGIPYPGAPASSRASGAPTSTGSFSSKRPIAASPNIEVDSAIPPPIPLLYNIPLIPLQFNFQDLLALEQCGEKVEWPAGFNAGRASAFMADYEWAVRVGGLYTFKPSVTPIDESTSIQVSQHFGCSSAVEEPEPGQRPLVTGSTEPADPIRPPVAPIRGIRRRCITLSEYERFKQINT